jgi:coenzyme F420-0:L-glutamate ligase/coenzyme F420-1:gamma-L-glutamate ligase
VITAWALDGLPEVDPGFDLAAAIVERSAAGLDAGGVEGPLRSSDVVVIAHKAVSKAEGRVVCLADVAPGDEARRLAGEVDKDPRQVQVILDESRAVIRAAPGVLITETRHGFICANAGVDASNVPGQETLVLLPLDPDASARAIRARIGELSGVAPAVLITDSFGRAWRIGQADVCVGCAGLAPVEDWRGEADAHGRELRATVIAVADELAGAADLARRKDASQPVVIVRGAGRHVAGAGLDGPGAQALIRAAEHDLFR